MLPVRSSFAALTTALITRNEARWTIIVIGIIIAIIIIVMIIVAYIINIIIVTIIALTYHTQWGLAEQ